MVLWHIITGFSLSLLVMFGSYGVCYSFYTMSLKWKRKVLVLSVVLTRG